VFDGDPRTSVELVCRNAIHAGTVELAPDLRRHGRLQDIDLRAHVSITIQHVASGDVGGGGGSDDGDGAAAGAAAAAGGSGGGSGGGCGGSGDGGGDASLKEEAHYSAALCEIPDGPLGTTSWLARELSTKPNDGVLLRRRGTVVLTSSPAGLYPVRAGDVITVSWCGMTVAASVVR
jgi:hypothetical protein